MGHTSYLTLNPRYEAQKRSCGDPNPSTIYLPFMVGRNTQHTLHDTILAALHYSFLSFLHAPIRTHAHAPWFDATHVMPGGG
jgi:hypothetical protein